MLTVCLATKDRRRAFDFYRDALGLEPIGEPAEDGVPEPLQFVLSGGTRLMLIPTGGFGWVLGDQPAAPAGTSECILSLGLESVAAVDRCHSRAVAAGAVSVNPPTDHPWGYTATFTDPDGHLWQVMGPPSD